MSVHEVQVGGARPYRVRVGAGVLSELPEAIASRARIAVLTDVHVEQLYADRLGPLASAPRLAVDAGEDSKSFATLERVLEFLTASDLDRGSALVLLGGGVVGDLGGLAASLYMRGIDAVQCPTTLLSQVDSSVGGKTAVNLGAGKNLAGTFHPPCHVLADVATLGTLPDDELASGLGEVVKTALIGDPELLDLLEASSTAVRARDPEILAVLVTRCVGVKAGVVERDERESGERKHLNLGHTFGHAIEHVAGYGTIPHGVAVGTGLGLALEAAHKNGNLADDSLLERVPRILSSLGLQPDLAGLRQRYDLVLETEALIDGLRHDKKGSAGTPQFVLPVRAGELLRDVPLDVDLLRELFG